MALSSSTTITGSSSQISHLPAFLDQSKAQLHAKFIDLEWQQRNRLLQGTQHPTNPSDPPSQWSRLSGDAIAARNRYVNVEPYAQKRIKLKVVREGESDYINASPIVLGRRRYIATQGPKETGVNHFYRMLAQECHGGRAVVVMLTQTHEAGREKCFQYYPLREEEKPLVIPADDPEEVVEDAVKESVKGEVWLESVEEHAESRSEVRRLRLRWTTPATGEGDSEAEVEEKEIQHLLFSAWPDFLVPEGEDRRALLNLVRLSESLNRGPSTFTSSPDTSPPPQTNSNSAHVSAPAAHDPAQEEDPRIIHCSAGVGRSGTFIALDYLLGLLHAGELDDLPAGRDPVAETVDLLRQQRMMMVQGEAQFNFLYEVLRDEFTGRSAGGRREMNGSGDGDGEADAVAGAERTE